MHSPPRLLPRLLLSFAALILGLVMPLSAQEAGRVIVLGFDGADARTTRSMIEAGELPNLARLAQDGTFAPLVSTNPAESAAGWAAINTGATPAESQVPSFVMRIFDEGGRPMPTTGHTDTRTRPVTDFDHGGLMKLLTGFEGPVLAAGFGLLVLVAFLVVFAGLLRVKRSLAFPLALLLGAVGAWGALTARSYVPREVPGVSVNRLAADNFWEIAARAGVDSVVLDAALAFDRPTLEHARVLGGLGLPDLRGGQNGEWFIYTTDEFVLDRPPQGDLTSSSAGTVFRVDERDGQISTEIYGPKNFYLSEKVQRRLKAIGELVDDPDLGWQETNSLRDEQRELEGRLSERVSVPMVIRREEGKARVTIDSQSQVIGEGEWSDWYRLNFQMNPLLRASAVTRVKLMSLDEPFELFVNNLEIDPSAPPFWQPISMPNDFAAELVEWIGEPYETTGWSCMTNQLKDKKLDVETFLEDIEFTMTWREKLTYAALERRDWRLLFSVFSTPDRVQHMMYKYYDPEHPLHDPQEAAREVEFFGERVALKDVIPMMYRQADRIVGTVQERYLEPDDTLLLCADHGFTSYRRGVNLNNWLAEEGYLVLKDGISRGDANVLDFYVDWSRTRAYSLGLGMIFLNLKGREAQGIVEPGQADALMAEIGAALLRYEDPEQEGQKVCLDVAVMKDLYPGPWGTPDYPCSDLMVGFAENYRIEWNNVVGKITLRTDDDGNVVLGPTVRDNGNNWSGDHASNSPDLVTGIFFSNRPVQVPGDGISVMHIAPTVLARLGVAAPVGFLPPLAPR